MRLAGLIEAFFTNGEELKVRESISSRVARINEYLTGHPDDQDILRWIHLGRTIARTDRFAAHVFSDVGLDPGIIQDNSLTLDGIHGAALVLGQEIFGYQADYNSWERPLSQVLKPLLQRVGYTPRDFFLMLREELPPNYE